MHELMHLGRDLHLHWNGTDADVRQLQQRHAISNMQHDRRFLDWRMGRMHRSRTVCAYDDSVVWVRHADMQ